MVILPLAINLNENWMYTVLVQSRSLDTSILSPSCKHRIYHVNISSHYWVYSAAYCCLDVVCYWLLVAARGDVLCATPFPRQKMGTVTLLVKWTKMWQRHSYMATYRHSYSSFSSCSEPLGCDWICKHWLRHWVQANALIFCANHTVAKHPNFQGGTVLSRSSFLYLKTYFVQISSSGATCWSVRKGNTQETSRGSLSACPALQLSSLLCGSWGQSQSLLCRDLAKPLRASLFPDPFSSENNLQEQAMQILDNSHLMIRDLNNLKRLNWSQAFANKYFKELIYVPNIV